MKCLVCPVTFEGQVCPQCGYDHSAAGAREPDRILAAKEAFREKVSAYAPDSRVTWKDRAVPWIAFAMAALLFLGWLKACTAMGSRFF